MKRCAALLLLCACGAAPDLKHSQPKSYETQSPSEGFVVRHAIALKSACDPKVVRETLLKSAEESESDCKRASEIHKGSSLSKCPSGSCIDSETTSGGSRSSWSVDVSYERFPEGASQQNQVVAQIRYTFSKGRARKLSCVATLDTPSFRAIEKVIYDSARACRGTPQPGAETTFCDREKRAREESTRFVDGLKSMCKAWNEDSKAKGGVYCSKPTSCPDYFLKEERTQGAKTVFSLRHNTSTGGFEGQVSLELGSGRADFSGFLCFPVELLPVTKRFRRYAEERYQVDIKTEQCPTR